MTDKGNHLDQSDNANSSVQCTGIRCKILSRRCFRSSFSSDTSSSRPDLGIQSRKSSYSQGPPRLMINGEQQPTTRRKSDDEPPATLPRIVEVKRARRSSDGHRPTKNRKTVEVFRWLRQAPKTELEALSKMSEDEIKHCIIQALKDKDPT